MTLQAVLISCNHQSSSLTSNGLLNPKKRLSGPLSSCNYFQSAAEGAVPLASPLPTQPRALPVGPLGEGGGSATLALQLLAGAIARGAETCRVVGGRHHLSVC